MKTEQLERPEGDGWRPIVGDDGQIRAWVRGSVPTKAPAKPTPDNPAEVIERTDAGGIVHREVGPLVTR